MSGLIRGSTLHSAYDGEHAYRVVVSVMPEVIESDDPDSRVDWTSVRWTTDPAFVDQVDYPELAGAALLTTKRAGKTRIGVSLETTAGAKLRGAATLEISAASSDERQAGHDYFSFGTTIGVTHPEWKGLCGFDALIELPTATACGSCHGEQKGVLGGTLSSLNTTEYTDDELIAAFAHGGPIRGISSEFLTAVQRDHKDVDCVLRHFHRGEDVDEHIERGLLWKVRSLAPVVPAGFDLELLNHFKRDGGAAPTPTR